MKVLFISPHTDDVELGAGGTMCRMLDEGHEVHWLALSWADSAVPKNSPMDSILKEFYQVVDFLGIPQDQVYSTNFPVTRFAQNRQEILDIILNVRENIRPDIVIGPGSNDVHQDHIVVHNEVVRLFKTSSKILGYEMPWNNLNFSSQYLYKLTEDQFERKLKLLSFYKSQNELGRLYFDADVVRGLARVRGLQCSAKYAEAFEIIRWSD